MVLDRPPYDLTGIGQVTTAVAPPVSGLSAFKSGSTQAVSAALLEVRVCVGFWNSVKIKRILVIFPNQTTQELFSAYVCEVNWSPKPP